MWQDAVAAPDADAVDADAAAATTWCGEKCNVVARTLAHAAWA